MAIRNPETERAFTDEEENVKQPNGGGNRNI